MRVLLVTDRHSAEGGAERSFSEIALGLDDRGHDVSIVARDLSPEAAPLPERIALHKIRWAKEGEPPDAAAVSRVAELARGLAPDVVHLHSVFDAGVVRALGAWPSVWTVHDHRAHCPNGDRVFPRSGRTCELPMGSACLWNAVAQGCVRGPRVSTARALRLRQSLWSALAASDRICSSSSIVTALLQRNGASPARVAHVSLFTSFAEKQLPAVEPTSTALFAARLVPQKGVADALWVAKNLRRNDGRPALAVAGDGPLAGDCEASAAQGTIEYLGRLTTEAMALAYRRAAAVMLAPKWLDPFPLVALEALACGRPVVAYHRGGISELVTNEENGLLVEPDDRHALAVALDRLRADPHFAAQLGANGRRLVRERYRPRHGLAAIERIYNEARATRSLGDPQPDVRLSQFPAAADAPAWPEALAVRLAVFVREQDVPYEAEIDEHDTTDPTCVHMLGKASSGRPVATGRVFEESAGIGRIGRMAVLPAYRGLGLGRRILDELIEHARRCGWTEAVLDAQIQARDFYRRRGFAVEGGVFDDAGIPHQRMRAHLKA